MSDDITPTSGPNPSGLCMCGCGAPVPMSTRTRPEQGLIEGQPVRFLRAHAARLRPGNRSNSRCARAAKPLEDRYLVEPITGCWLWMGQLDRHGYPKHKEHRRTVGGHRWVYELLKGPVPIGLQLDHICRERSCVNPDHLEPVTGAENVRRGELPKLNVSAIAQIRWLLSRDAPPTDVQLASAFGVTAPNIRAIRTGYTWRGVEPAEPPEPLRGMPRIDGRGHRVKRPLDSVTVEV